MKTKIVKSKMMKNWMTVISMFVVLVSLMSFRVHAKADTSVQLPGVEVITQGTFYIPAQGGEVTIYVTEGVTFALSDIDTYISQTNTLLRSKDDANVCITSMMMTDAYSGYMTLSFGPNMFSDEQVIGVVGARGGDVSVVQAAE